MPFGGALTIGLGAAAGGVAQGLMSGGGSSESGYSLPPELEIQMLKQFQDSLSQTEAQKQQNSQMLDLFNRRADTLYKAMQGTMPSADAMKSLTASSSEIAMAFGGSASEAIKAGFLDAGAAKAANLIQEREGQMHDYQQGILDNLKTMEASNWVDPAVQHQQEDQRRQLQQDLQRQGVSPAGQQAAMTQFDRGAQDQLFARSQDLKNNLTQRGNMQLGMAGSAFGQSTQGILGAAGLNLQGQQQQYSQAMGEFGAVQSQLQYGQNTIGNMGALAGTQFNAGQTSLQTSRQLTADPQNAFNQIGQYKFSGNAKAALGSGLAGNQSFYDQTGFGKGGSVGGIKNYNAAYQNNARQQATIDRYNSTQQRVNIFGGNAQVTTYTPKSFK